MKFPSQLEATYPSSCHIPGRGTDPSILNGEMDWIRLHETLETEYKERYETESDPRTGHGATFAQAIHIVNVSSRWQEAE